MWQLFSAYANRIRTFKKSLTRPHASKRKPYCIAISNMWEGSSCVHSQCQGGREWSVWISMNVAGSGFSGSNATQRSQTRSKIPLPKLPTRRLVSSIPAWCFLKLSINWDVIFTVLPCGAGGDQHSYLRFFRYYWSYQVDGHIFGRQRLPSRCCVDW